MSKEERHQLTRDIAFNTSVIAEEFINLNKHLEGLGEKLDKVLELNAEHLIRTLWTTLEKIVEEDHP